MKGTFFSADFVTDKDDNLRLIEINTDTGILESQKWVFDWSDFISVLSTNNITEVEVVYKYDIQKDIIASLSEALTNNAPFITSFTEHVVAAESIFPTSPTDSTSKFIVRLAYDESAILDSEYAKGTLNLLKLFSDAEDPSSVTNFYHSSSYYGFYDTLDKTQFNGTALPDVVTKTVLETHQPHKFYKIGNSDSGSLERYDSFVDRVSTSDNILQQYHIPQSQITRGTVSSIRSFQIVYGSNLDICYVAQYEIDSILDLPTSITYDDSRIDNEIESKHYYEYATNTIKNKNHGLLENEKILDSNDVGVELKDLVLGNSYKSVYIEGAPNTDDMEVLRQWSYSGSTLPSGSYVTSSVLVGKFEDTTYANDLTEIIYEDGSDAIIGGEARMLVYNSDTDLLTYKRVVDLTTDDSVLGQDNNLNKISQINLVIYDEQQPVYMMNMEDVDNFVLESGNFASFFVVHNLIGGGCFIAGTKIKMADDSEKNIEDVQVGDVVMSFNETTNEKEPKVVTDTKQPIHNDIVKYTFDKLLIDGIDPVYLSLTCTLDHPIYVNGLNLGSYNPRLTSERYTSLDKPVQALESDDVVNLFDGTTSVLNGFKRLPEVDTQTYIITVEDNHNFYANNILVHNK
jgi:hypothetical protein